MAVLRERIAVWSFSFIAPFVLAALTMLANWIQPTVPLPWLIAAAALVFMSVTNAILNMKQMSYQDNPEGKLMIAGPIIGKYYERGKLSGIKYGLTYTNQGWFPIQFKITPKQVSLGSNINPKPIREITGGIAQIGSTGVFWEAVVPVSRDMKNETIEGHLDVDISYGKVGKLRHTLRKKFIIHVSFQPSGEISNYEASEIMTNE